MFQGAVEMLRDNAQNARNFVDQQDGDSKPTRSDFVAALSLTIATGDSFTKQHDGSEHFTVVQALLKESREIEVLKPTAPNPELTAKLKDMADRASKLKMRPMTKEEQASIQQKIK